ncbi:hypothetical protein Ddye_020492 [Dipteronia dyeriana]|uniref:MULE transposase domain-containing protein n=1 Tax=Dipteronia dyeriana TaxID=168575 RepID=A0AAD9U0C4_9ROSI|nr:hypothetical protein Ddye_020492 [Dipteronia dyeriana]
MILSNPSIDAIVIKNELRNKFGVQASSQSIYRAKKRVLKNLIADHIEAYTMIWRYANMCLVMNPGTYAKTGCRPLIGIDGCHLTSEYGGVLLAAIALDADSGIFPIAYAVCETECKDSWEWFLKLLHEALNWDDNKRVCFMSDRQKGILAALKSEWPTSNNRTERRREIAWMSLKNEKIDDMKTQAIIIAVLFAFTFGLLSSTFAVILGITNPSQASKFDELLSSCEGIFVILLTAVLGFGTAMSLSSLYIRYFAWRVIVTQNIALLKTLAAQYDLSTRGGPRCCIIISVLQIKSVVY